MEVMMNLGTHKIITWLIGRNGKRTLKKEGGVKTSMRSYLTRVHQVKNPKGRGGGEDLGSNLALPMECQQQIMTFRQRKNRYHVR